MVLYKCKNVVTTFLFLSVTTQNSNRDVMAGTVPLILSKHGEQI